MYCSFDCINRSKAGVSYETNIKQDISDQDEVIFTQMTRLRKHSLAKVYMDHEVLVFLGKSWWTNPINRGSKPSRNPVIRTFIYLTIWEMSDCSFTSSDVVKKVSFRTVARIALFGSISFHSTSFENQFCLQTFRTKVGQTQTKVFRKRSYFASFQSRWKTNFLLKNLVNSISRLHLTGAVASLRFICKIRGPVL